MTNPNTQDIAGIAAGLSITMADALSGAWEYEEFDEHNKPVTSIYHDGQSRSGAALLRRGLVTNRGALTPLGLAVRSHIMEENQ